MILAEKIIKYLIEKFIYIMRLLIDVINDGKYVDKD